MQTPSVHDQYVASHCTKENIKKFAIKRTGFMYCVGAITSIVIVAWGWSEMQSIDPNNPLEVIIGGLVGLVGIAIYVIASIIVVAIIGAIIRSSMRNSMMKECQKEPTKYAPSNLASKKGWHINLFSRQKLQYRF